MSDISFQVRFSILCTDIYIIDYTLNFIEYIFINFLVLIIVSDLTMQYAVNSQLVHHLYRWL